MAGETAAGFLQELAVKAGTTPEYECVDHGIAKQALFPEMSRAGHRGPAPFCLPRAPAPKDALTRNVYKNMIEEVKDQSNKNKPWRPPLDQKLSEYQCGLVLQFNEERRALAVEALRSTAAAHQPPSVQLECAASALGIEPVWGSMPSKTVTPLVTVELPDTSPSLVYVGRDRDGAAAGMVRYLNSFLMNPPREPLLEFAPLEILRSNLPPHPPSRMSSEDGKAQECRRM